MRPQYPIYIPSKGRAATCLTARMLQQDQLPFFVVIEPQEYDAYAAVLDPACLLVLPFQNLGLGSIPARNWIWDHALASGAQRHWILDDNLRGMCRLYQAKRLPCAPAPALAWMETFVERYENIAIAGPNYSMFVMGQTQRTPFDLNNHVYSCLLILNRLPYRWRGRYNEDTDLCLQVLAGGWCTVLFNAFLINKMTTMTMKGGNSDVLYQGDGRLHMARSLERQWPGVVKTTRVFQRPQHRVKNQWQDFDTPLKRRTDLDWSQFGAASDERGFTLVQVKPEVKSPRLRHILEAYQQKPPLV